MHQTIAKNINENIGIVRKTPSYYVIMNEGELIKCRTIKLYLQLQFSSFFEYTK